MELNDLLKYQGIELGEDATIEDYKKAFDSRFVTRENAIADPEIENHFAGKITQRYATELRNAAKENGIELEDEEKKKSPADLARLLIAKKQENLESKIEELTKNKKPAEEFTALQDKYGQLQKRYEEELGAKTELQKLVEEKEKQFVTFEKNFKLTEAKKNIFGNLNFSENANDLLKKGFYATIDEKYSIGLGDDDTPIITDKEGNRIKDPNKHGSFLTPSDVLANELNAAGLSKQVSQEKFPKPNERKEFKPALDNNGVKIATFAKPLNQY